MVTCSICFNGSFVLATKAHFTLFKKKKHEDPLQNKSAQEIWQQVNAVCFDVDSTGCLEEGIDVLAEHCNAGDAVREWTTKCVLYQKRFG